MRPLSALDASFVYLESSHAPMHIGGVYIIDAKQAPENFGYALFKQHIAERLGLSKVFRERLVEVPLHLSHPYWINDPDFELDFHLPQIAVPRPGGEVELMNLAAQCFSRPLDRSRPLWEIAFVDGLDQIPGLAKGSFALITKIHHAAVDGGSGAELMGALLDTSAQPRALGRTDKWRPEKVPSAAKMVSKAYARLGRKSLDFGKFVGEVASGAGRVYGVNKVKRLKPPPLPLSAPRSVFNTGISAQRTFWGLEIDFQRIRTLKNRLSELGQTKITVNDVVLGICAEGLRNYLLEQQALPAKPLVAMAPVSVRSSAQKAQMGNQVSAMLVNLETQLEDPLQRVLRIHQNTLGSKVYSSAIPANKITEFIPSETSALAARLYTRMKLGKKHRPFFNLVITNVPGPPMPLYLAGAEVRRSFGTAPIMDGLGLMLVVFSYAGRLSISITSCQEVVAEPALLGDRFDQALRDIEQAAEQTAQVELRMAGEAAAETGVLGEAIAALDRSIKDLERIK